MRRERFDRLAAQLSAGGLDGLVLLRFICVNLTPTGAAMPALQRR